MQHNFKKILKTLILLIAINTSHAGDFIFSSGFEAIQNQVLLGNLTGAQINAYQLDDLTNAIETTTSSTSTNLQTAGSFELSLAAIQNDEWILVSATGGNDIDADDDGVLDATATTNNGTIYALAKAGDWKAGGKHITALTDIAWKYTENLLGAIQPTELIIRQNELAQQFIQTDINKDSTIDYLDILAFVPNDQAQRANLNFNYQALLDVNANNESYILATHAGATNLVEDILDDLFAHTITRHVVPDHRYNTIVIDVSVFGNGSITTTTNKTIASHKKGKINNKIYLTKGTNQTTTFTATPDTGYYVYSWSGCDSTSNDFSQCFVNTNSNHDIFASFASDTTTYETNFTVVDISQAAVVGVQNVTGTSTLDIEINVGYASLIAQMDALVVGDVLAGTSVYDGFLGQIITYTPVFSSNPNIKRYIIETADVTLDDLIKQGTGNLTQQLTNGDLHDYFPATTNKAASISSATYTAIDGVKLIPSQNADDTTFTLQFGTSSDKANSTYSVPIYQQGGASISASGTVGFTIDLDTGFNFGLFSGLQDFKFITKITANEELNITATGALPEFTAEKKIATLNFSKIKFFIGILPVWVTPTVDFYLGATGEISTTITTGVTWDQTITAGIRYNKDAGFSKVKSFTNHETPSYPTATTEASLKVYLKAQASMLIYDATGPSVSLSPYVQLDSSAAIGGDAWFIDHCVNGVDVGLSVGLSSEFYWDLSSGSKVGELLHLDELENFSRFELFNLNKPLHKWSIGGTCAGETPFMLVEGDPIIATRDYDPSNTTALSTNITLSNQGVDPFNWSSLYVAGTEIQISPTSGTLNAGDTSIITITLDTSGLSVGRYLNPILLENLFDPSVPTQDSGTTSVPITVDILPVDNINSPSITSLTSPSAGNINLTWALDLTSLTVPINRYEIYSTTTPADPNSWNLETIVTKNVNSITKSGFVGGTTVSFYVVARGAGEITTPISNIMSVTISGNVPLPATGRLNDTGITWGGDYSSGNNATCTSNIASPQDCNQGRDASHNDDTDGHAGFSFTKLDEFGNPLAASASSWSCVRDNVTGLVWEVKNTDSNSIHYKNNTYRWGGISHQGSNFGSYYNDWDVLLNGTNAESLCGFNDWRVPNTTELMSIVDNSRYNPSIDTDYFPNTNSSNFWSASPFASSSDSAWRVVFNFGYSSNYYRNSDRNVRLVRFGQ